MVASIAFVAAQVLAAQRWQAPDSTQFLAALCKFLQEDGAGYFSVDRNAVVQVSPLPPFCEEAKDSGEEEHAMGRPGLTIETPLTASMVDVDASDVLRSTDSLMEALQRFLEARSIALFEAEAAANCG